MFPGKTVAFEKVDNTHTVKVKNCCDAQTIQSKYLNHILGKCPSRISIKILEK